MKKRLTVPQALDMAVALHRAGRLDQARDLYRRVLGIDPGQPVALHLLGVLAHQAGRHQEALDLMARALAVQPDFPEALSNQGVVLRELGRLDQAADAFRQALRLRPGFPEAHNGLGNTLTDLGRPDEAADSLREALRLRPDFVEAHINLGNALKNLGRRQEAAEALRRAVGLAPGHAGALSNLLFLEQYRPGVDACRLNALHQEWDARHAAPLRDQWPVHPNDPDPDRTVRVGLVSANLRVHPVGWFAIRLLENRPQGLEFLCYSDARPDRMTERFRRAAHGWVDTAAMDDVALAARILADRVDILFHLSGHGAGNRLLAMARRPAPVHASWVGYPGPAGLSAMDFFLADPMHSPVDEEETGPERPIRLPHGYVCYEPPDYAPDVGPLPCLANGHATFGSFNNPAKINGRVLAAWAAVLKRVPGSRLALRYTAMDCAGNRERILGAMAAHGVDASRVSLAGRTPHSGLLAAYNHVDVALDTFPYSGGLTTCEALHMGVPVVTFPGATFAGRHSASHLANAGLPELVAKDVDEYVELAVALASDTARLAELRSGLRERMPSSPLCDGPLFARHFGAAMREIWGQWCRTAE